MGELQRASLSRPAPLLASPRRAASDAPITAGTGHVEAVRALSPVRAIQASLALGSVGDPFEREAERVSDLVSSANTPSRSVAAVPPAAALAPFMQRAVGKGEPPTTKDEDEKKKVAQKDAVFAISPDVVPSGVESSIASMTTLGQGQPLPASERATF